MPRVSSGFVPPRLQEPQEPQFLRQNQHEQPCSHRADDAQHDPRRGQAGLAARVYGVASAAAGQNPADQPHKPVSRKEKRCQRNHESGDAQAVGGSRRRIFRLHGGSHPPLFFRGEWMPAIGASVLLSIEMLPAMNAVWHFPLLLCGFAVSNYNLFQVNCQYSETG